MMSEKPLIAKLQGAENYASWSADLRLILRRDKNWSLINGPDTKPPPMHIPDPSLTSFPLATTTAKQPPMISDPTFMTPPDVTHAEPPTIPNPDYEKWVARSIDVLYKIQLTCDEVVKPHIRHLEVPATVWQTLRDLYEPKGASMQSTLVNKIFRTTLGDYASVADYLAAVETGAADYIAAGPYGCPAIPDHLLVLTVLHGLPSAFQVVVTTILSRAGGGLLSLAAVKADLLDEERRLIDARVLN